ncbi:MAG TPA: filamentous hemagglutinin N-terminal domain-containing protein, partial [Limnobacter sp.]|nr:filamentous hemagglutinin N-terminal domain-containing protein [Limnobacter sp.]
MNKIFQVTWNSARQVWVVASELAQGDRPPKSQARVASSGLLMALVSALTVAVAPQAHAQPLANELPTGGTVLIGNATTQLNGNQLLINQASDRALTQWNSFNIGAAASVQINQPTALSSSVNRVLSNDPSRIFGSLTSNGQVVLINPAGVVFGPTARVDAGSIIASTLNLSNEDFAQGKLNFSNNASTAGTVSNQGLLKAGQGGYVALIGPRLENTGTLQANQGQVLLGAGERIALSRGQDGLINMSVDAGALDAQIRLGGVLQANDGSAVVTARAEGALSKSAINMDGLVEAKGLTAQGGKIILDSGVNGTTEVTGVLNAGSEAGKGGVVHLLGEQVGLFGHARVNASGATGGGEVLVGGDMLGQGSIPTSRAAVLDSDAVIHADAGLSGKGGKVVLWSDEYTGMYGQITAKGGQANGDGGFVETSSKDNLQAYGSVDTSARNSRAGEWLLDPRNVTIVNPGL